MTESKKAQLNRKFAEGKSIRLNSQIIIQMAKEMYKSKGDAFTMRDIARKLDTRASSLYRHVANKRELV